MGKTQRKSIVIAVMLSALITSFVISEFLMPIAANIREGRLITSSDGYPLIRGYNYRVYRSGHHQLVKDNHFPRNLGLHLNRIYIDDRFIVGEVSVLPTSENNLDPQSLDITYKYFILDTETDKYVTGLDKSAWETELSSLGILQDVNLRGRQHSRWLKPQRKWNFF